MASKFVEAVVKALSMPNHQENANVALQEKLNLLEQKLANLSSQPTIPQAKLEPIIQAKPEPEATPLIPEAKQAEPVETKANSQPSKQNGNGTATEPDPEKAEKWTRENLEEWFESPCSFAKAQGRTWKQLAHNEGEKIIVKEKPVLPRAYLHALESWSECNIWARLKAKVALEVGKNGTHNHYNHPNE